MDGFSGERPPLFTGNSVHRQLSHVSEARIRKAQDSAAGAVVDPEFIESRCSARGTRSESNQETAMCTAKYRTLRHIVIVNLVGRTKPHLEMDDRFFIDQLDQNPNDPKILREYAQWLSANDDARGELLTAELDRRELQSRADDLRNRVFKFAADAEAEWLDIVFPLLVRSPCNGTFYVGPSPDSSPFLYAAITAHRIQSLA